VVAAAGSAPHDGGFARLDPDRLTLRYNGTTVLAWGVPQAAEPDPGNGACSIELDLALGAGAASYLTSDLSTDYVRINADYRS
jgi:N-acetylglutamate synthase/N-acetylornithine aminotransferase